MTFEEVLTQAIAMLQRLGRVSYRALKRQFDLDDDYLADLKDAILYAHPQVIDDGRGLAWAGKAETPPDATSSTLPPAQHEVPQKKQQIQTKSPRSEPPTPNAERRQLTVMFCDLADATKLSGQLDPEDLRDVIRAYQSTSAEVIERYDGYIAQHLGDGLMVYFGWPQAHEDDAQRAVHAGLGIVESMGGLNTRLEQEKDIRLAVRIGIHTGLVVVGEIGQGASQEHLALGETPNIASRIQSVAEPDTVATSVATYQLVQGYFVCEDVGHHRLKGVNDAHQVYRVLRESDAQSRLDVAAASGLTPLIGRESEVTLLLERWQQVKEGQGQIVLLSGEAGIGKSRLLRVLREHIANQLHTLQDCRCSPYHTQSAFYPLIDLLQRKLHWQSADTVPARLHKLETVLGQTHLDRETAVPLFSSLLSLPLPDGRYAPLTLSSQRQRQETLEAFLRIVLLATEQHPVLFIVEDVHWVDPSTLEFLDLLIGQAASAALLIVLTCRPEFQSPWGLRTYLTPIALNRLTRPQIEQMVGRVSGEKSLPPEVMRQLVEKTDGVPLYIEEMTKAVLETGTLQQTAGDDKPIATVGSLAIPATLQDSLMSRLDRLGSAKAVAQYGAVIGRQFSYDLLYAAAPFEAAMLQRALKRLVESELLYQRGLPPTATYTFKHALIQDVAYQSLLKSTRQHYHQAIVQTLVERFPEITATQPELLAHHYTEAGLNERAVLYWSRAGERAHMRSADLEAISHLRKGLDTLAILPNTAARDCHELSLQTMLGQTLKDTRGYGATEVARVYTRVRELCQQSPESPELFRALLGQSIYCIARAELQSAYELGERLLEFAKRDRDPVFLVEAYYALGVSAFWLGKFIPAHEYLMQGIAHYDPERHHAHIALFGQDGGAVCLCRVAVVLWYLGFPDQALAMSQQALTLVQQLGHPFSMAYVQLWTVLFHHLRREPVKARKLTEAVMALSIEQGFSYWSTQATIMQGWTYAQQGPATDGIAQIQQGLIKLHRTGTLQLDPYFFGILAELYRDTGQLQEGFRALDSAIASVDRHEARYYEAELYRLKGELLLNAESTPEVCFQHALSIARQQQAKSLELRAATSLARLWQSQGKRQEAYDLLQPVYDWFTEGFDTADLQDANALLVALR